jgi:hypothetical protein
MYVQLIVTFALDLPFLNEVSHVMFRVISHLVIASQLDKPEGTQLRIST